MTSNFYASTHTHSHTYLSHTQHIQTQITGAQVHDLHDCFFYIARPNRTVACMGFSDAHSWFTCTNWGFHSEPKLCCTLHSPFLSLLSLLASHDYFWTNEIFRSSLLLSKTIWMEVREMHIWYITFFALFHSLVVLLWINRVHSTW